MVAWLWVTVAVASGCGPDPVSESLTRFEALLVQPEGDRELAFAQCLWELGLRHSAQQHALEVVRLGPGDPAFSDALSTAMSWSRELGDLYSALPYLRGVSRRHVADDTGRDDVLLAHGMFLRVTGQPIRAAGVLEEVRADYPWADRARFQLGQALWEANQLREAVDTWNAVEGQPWVIDAQMARAEALADWGETADAVTALSHVDASDPRAGMARLKQAGWWMRLGDADEARQTLVHARQQGGRAWPQWHLRWAEVSADACRTSSVHRHARSLEAEWGPIALALDGIADSGHPNGRSLYAQFLGPDPVDMGLPDVLHARATADPDLLGLLGHLDQIVDERQQLDAIAHPAFEAILKPHLSDVLQQGERELQAQAGRLYGRSLAQQRVAVREALAAGAALVDSLDRTCR